MLMDDTGISTISLFVLWIHFQHSNKWHDAIRNPLLQKDDVTHNSLYTEQLLSAHALTQRGLHREKLLHTDAFIHRGFYANRF